MRFNRYNKSGFLREMNRVYADIRPNINRYTSAYQTVCSVNTERLVFFKEIMELSYSCPELITMILAMKGEKQRKLQQSSIGQTFAQQKRKNVKGDQQGPNDTKPSD